MLFLVAGVGGWVAKVGGSATWQMCLVAVAAVVFIFFFHSAGHKVLKSFILRLFCWTRAPLSESQSHQVTN